MIDPDSIPVGACAYDSEGEQLGEVAEVGGSGIVLRDDSGALHWVPLHAVRDVDAGRLVLRNRGLP